MTFDPCPYCKSERVVAFGDMNARMAQCLDCGGQWQPPPHVTEAAGKAHDHWQSDPSWHPAADGESKGRWSDLFDFDE